MSLDVPQLAYDLQGYVRDGNVHCVQKGESQKDKVFPSRESGDLEGASN